MLHGDMFEFFRNTALDARNYFSPERATFNQNQPGGTIGGPLKRQKVFFFADYEATRTTQGIETGRMPVPSGAERAGNFAHVASSLTGTVNGRYWANLLSQRLGYAVSPGEPYYFPGCTTAAQCVLPNAMIPQQAWSSPAQRLLQYIPPPNSGENLFSTGAFAKTVRDDKFAYRVDGNSRLGLLSGYYFFDDYRLDNPYPCQQGGANVPGFDALTLGRAQLFAVGDNTVMRNGAVNEFHATFTRNANNVGFPNGGRGVSLASQGFVTGPATPGIVVQAPELEGVENIAFDALTMGVTFNYGMRWDVMQPWYERDNQIQTIVPGQNSVVFPGAPLGLVVPGDPGIGRGLSPTRWDNVAPRVGIAYAPSEKFSVRGSYGIFYTAFQGLSAGIMYGVPPYGYNYLSPAPPLFETPFVTAADGTNNGQRFPLPPPPLGASAGNPVSNIDWSKFIPVNADPFFGNDNKTPYSENYMLSVQRELAANAVATASYVGSRGHNILVIRQANPGNPALCLSVSQPDQVAPGSPRCGPFAENSIFVTKDGQVINGTRGPLGPAYGTMTRQETTGYSRYNALELNLRYTRGNASVQAGYTLSKSVDVASNLGEQVNPFDIHRSEAPSAFDMRHNFVVSYNYDLPFGRLFGRRNEWTERWTISGTTRFSSGFPVTLYNSADTSLLGTFGNGVNNNLVDTANYSPGCDLQVNRDPAKGPAFNTSCFSLPALGEIGSAPRRFCYGPGIQNFDMALIKNVSLTPNKSLQVRVEAFNVLNQPQFYGAGAVDGNITSSTFGQIVAAASPRLIQIATKFVF